MNRSTSGLLLSKAITGFLQFKAAEGLSPATLTRVTSTWVDDLDSRLTCPRSAAERGLPPKCNGAGLAGSA